MARRMICALLLSLCLTACGTGQTEPSSELPQESLLEQESDQAEQDAQTLAEEEPMLKITVGDYALTAVFEDNSSAEEFRELLAQGPVTVEMEDYGGFEKVGPLGTTLSRNDVQITTEPGDVILYQGESNHHLLWNQYLELHPPCPNRRSHRFAGKAGRRNRCRHILPGIEIGPAAAAKQAAVK